MKSLIPMDDYGVFVDKHDTARVDSRYVAQFFEKEHRANVINLKRLLNGKQNVWKYQNGEEKSDSDGREKDV